MIFFQAVCSAWFPEWSRYDMVKPNVNYAETLRVQVTEFKSCRADLDALAQVSGAAGLGAVLSTGADLE